MENDIVKLVYFDEGSATDFIQIESGGSLSNVMTLLEENGTSGEAGADAKVGVKSKIMKALLGLDASVSVEGSIDTSFNSGTVVKSILSNTMLTDFLAAMTREDGGKSPIEEFTDLRIEQIPGSISSMALFTPYFTMFRSGQGIAAGDYDISLDKLDSALSKAKGYLDFFGSREGGTDVVLRFNSTAFKNNYRPSDLLKMDLRLYAVKVGSCGVDDLVADKELSMEGFLLKDNPDYVPSSVRAPSTEKKELDMYDVILAGVSSGGR